MRAHLRVIGKNKMKERIISLLSQGISASQVAAAVGCDDSYVSQIISDPEVFKSIQSARAENFSKYLETDSIADRAEKMALEKVEKLIPFISRPLEAVRTYQILNAAKRRTNGAEVASPAATIVTLEVPEKLAVSFKVTTDKQVIEVEGRTLTTMPAKSLTTRLAERNAARLLAVTPPAKLALSERL